MQANNLQKQEWAFSSGGLASYPGLDIVYFKGILFIYLWASLVAQTVKRLPAMCCMWAFSSCSEGRLLLVVVHRLLIMLASLIVERWF